MRDVLTGAGYAVSALFLLPVAGIAALLLWTLATNPFYAARVFDGLVLYDRVLASRGGHFSSDWGCTFAIVELASDAPSQSPSRTQREVKWWLVFGGEWRPTPAEALGDTTRDAIGECSQYFSDNVQCRLGVAVTEPGSWYFREPAGETVFIYSFPQRIAARIRFGD